MRLSIIALTATLVLVAASAACAHPKRTLPSPVPAFEGQLRQQSFHVDSTAPGHMWLFSVHRYGRPGVPAGYFRVDTLTKWVVARGNALDWDIAGLPEIRRAYVRVWLRGAPTSVTATEIWGRADVVVVDSLANVASPPAPSPLPR